MKIHSTALVDPKARIADGVEIGPYSIVGAEVVIGEKCLLGSHVVIEGDVEIGKQNIVGHGAIIGSMPQDFSFDAKTRSGVRIGERNKIREYCTIHRGTADGSMTTIGHENFLMAGAHLGHNARVGNHVVIANNCLLGGYAEIQDHAFLGGGCVFHQFIRVGRYAITQGGSAFSKDVPPFVVATGLNHVSGLNAVGLKRGSVSPAEREEIKAAFKLIYLSGLNTTQALTKAQEKKWNAQAEEFFEFIVTAKKRGFCAFRG